MPPVSRNAFVGSEFRRGVVYVTGSGAAGRVAVVAAAEVIRSDSTPRTG